MALYKYMTFENLKNVLNGTIRFTQPSAFNDPFEMVPELYAPKNIGPSINCQFSVTAPRRESKSYKLPKGFKSERCNDIVARNIRQELDKSIGVLCLSENPSSFLMWAHYANSYEGAVVEFDDTHDFFFGKFPMEYRTNRPKLDISAYISNQEPVPISEFCTKPVDWKHEAEVRVVRSLSDCKDISAKDPRGCPIFVMDIPSECVTAVVIGERMCINDQRSIWKIIESRDISLHLEAISNWDYKFRREPIKILGMANPVISPRTAHIFSEEDGTLGEIARFQLNRKQLAFVNDIL